MTFPINHPAVRFLAAPIVGAVILGGAALGLSSIASAESGDSSTSSSATSNRGPVGGAKSPAQRGPGGGATTAPPVANPGAAPRPKAVQPASPTDPSNPETSTQRGVKIGAVGTKPTVVDSGGVSAPVGLTPVEVPAPVVHTPVEVPGSAKLGPGGGGGLTPIKPPSPSAGG